MSDEKKEEKKEPRGCLTLIVVTLTALWVILVLVCYKKVEWSEIIPESPSALIEEIRDHYAKGDKPKETRPKATKPKEDATESDKLQGILDIMEELDDFLKENGKTDTTEPTTKKPKVTEPTTQKPKETEPAEKPEVTEPTTEQQEQRKYLVVIDAGHQAKGNNEKEPLGPGSETMKSKATSGTQGVATGIPEYDLNLKVAIKLQKVLEKRGYQVKMIRTKNDVDISNAERAAVANELEADAFIRLHANGDEKSTTHGIMTICQTRENPFNAEIYDQCHKLAQCVLEETVEATGGKKMFVWETDTLSGINWSKVPVTIIEMGYLTNPEEDKLLSTDEYRQKLAEGIANGIDRYFEKN